MVREKDGSLVSQRFGDNAPLLVADRRPGHSLRHAQSSWNTRLRHRPEPLSPLIVGEGVARSTRPERQPQQRPAVYPAPHALTLA